MNTKIKYSSISNYISYFPKEIQILLKLMQKTIQDAAPNAKEVISYQMPTFKLNGNLVHFAAYKNYIGFYPSPSAIIKFNNDLKSYKTSKGAIQFPIKEPLPLDLIKKIVKFRVLTVQFQPGAVAS